MIDIRIDLVPFGFYSAKRQIGFINITNDGTGNAEIGNYRYTVKDEHDNVVASGEYKGFYRDGGIFLLLNHILDDMHCGV